MYDRGHLTGEGGERRKERGVMPCNGGKLFIMGDKF